jgi:hypothetical protein
MKKICDPEFKILVLYYDCSIVLLLNLFDTIE